MFGSIGLILSGFLLAAAGYASLVTGVLHKWTGWLAIAAGVVNLAAAPSILGGTNMIGSTPRPDSRLLLPRQRC